MPKVVTLTIPYTYLLMSFASHAEHRLADPVAALLVDLIAIPALITSLFRHRSLRS